MSTTVAYVVSRFPHLPETFILREMNALERMGVQVALFPLLVQPQAIMHPESLGWMARLRQVELLSWACIIANLKRIMFQPIRYLSTLLIVLWHNLKSPKFLLRAAYIFPKAIWMAEMIKSSSIGHVHAHYATHPALAALIIKRMTGIPYSISVHAHDIYVNRTMLRQKLEEAEFVRAISQYNQDFLRARYGGQIAEKTHVLHSGIQPEKYHRKCLRTQVDQPFNIISVGSLQLYKGHRFLIEACSILKSRGIPFHCSIVGGGELFDELQSSVHSYEMDNEVDLLGPKNEEQVAELLGGADCFVLPSVITPAGKMEGLPVVLMEALASKLPVVATSISGIPELVENSVTGKLTTPGDAAKLADAMAWVYFHPQKAINLAKAGRNKVLEEFDQDKIIITLINLFDDNRYQYGAAPR